MSDFNRGFTSPVSARADMAVDAGLRAFMLGVYNKLALGLILSAALAYVTADIPAVRDQIYVVDADGRLMGFTLLGTVLRFAPLVVMLVGMFGMRNVTPRSSGVFYWTIVALIGAGLGVWMLAYTGVSVASTFLITAAAFGTLSLVGYTTKKDLTGFGNFLIMGLFGIIIAMLANMFLHLPGMAFIINILGVLIFAGLTAYDTQRLKMTYYQLGGSQTAMGVATNYGALSLYLNFINLFQFLLSFTGSRR
jgi:FtsH-binding integral membrane protein